MSSLWENPEGISHDPDESMTRRYPGIKPKSIFLTRGAPWRACNPALRPHFYGEFFSGGIHA